MTVVAAVATDTSAMTALPIVAAMLARDDPSSPSAGSIVTLCLAPWRWFCSREGLHFCMGGDGPRLHCHGKRLAKGPFISDASDTHLCHARTQTSGAADGEGGRVAMTGGQRRAVGGRGVVRRPGGFRRGSFRKFGEFAAESDRQCAGAGEKKMSSRSIPRNECTLICLLLIVWK